MLPDPRHAPFTDSVMLPLAHHRRHPRNWNCSRQAMRHSRGRIPPTDHGAVRTSSRSGPESGVFSTAIGIPNEDLYENENLYKKMKRLGVE